MPGWFERNTHHWGEWPMADLLAAKGTQRVSLVVPAKNEAATVGDVVRRLHDVLATPDVRGDQLVDEIVVIDSDSTDATAQVASAAGATVHASAEIRPDLGSHPGKGEAMWKSLFVATGDLVVFMDADLVEWDAHFVPGLLGPLLTRPEVELVKGFYHRPGEHGLDGGRVTELVARPLIALLCPELRDLVQPLAGEWAVRRSLFETLPVPTGYAVELAALVDTLRSRGLGAIAQVDLGRRGHRHQDLLDLGVMATQILAAMGRRFPELGGAAAGAVRGAAGGPVGGAAGEAVVLEQFVPRGDGVARARRDVLVAERPPAKEVR